MADYIELIDKYRIVQSKDKEYNPPSYDWVDNTGEIVRCKDCIRHTDEEPGMVYCPHIIGGWCDDDWYCKSGERRKDEYSD